MLELSEEKSTEASDDSSKDSQSVEKEEFDKEFTVKNAWRCSTLDWCGKCSIMVKTTGSLCCHEKVLKYNEYDEKLSVTQNQGFGFECIMTYLFSSKTCCREMCLIWMFCSNWKKVGCLEMISCNKPTNYSVWFHTVDVLNRSSQY